MRWNLRRKLRYLPETNYTRIALNDNTSTHTWVEYACRCLIYTPILLYNFPNHFTCTVRDEFPRRSALYPITRPLSTSTRHLSYYICSTYLSSCDTYLRELYQDAHHFYGWWRGGRDWQVCVQLPSSYWEIVLRSNNDLLLSSYVWLLIVNQIPFSNSTFQITWSP